MYPELKTTLTPDEREQEILRVWKERDIFHRSVSERDSNTIFSFYEGPPTVNGDPGIHHVISRTIKDTICRYKTMRGFRVERKAGWDTHGLPVEIAIEKKLGFKSIFALYFIFLSEFNHIWGLLLSIICAILGAIFSVLNGQFAQKYPSQIITFYEMLGVAISTAFSCFVYFDFRKY